MGETSVPVDPDAEGLNEIADCTVATTDDVEYVNPLMAGGRVGEEASDEATKEALAEVPGALEFVLSAAVNATTSAELLLSAFGTEDDALTASAATRSTLDEANGYAGTVRVPGKPGTDGTDGNETLETAGREGTATTVATDGSADTDSTDTCDGSAGVEGSTDCVSEGKDAMEGTSGVDSGDAEVMAVDADDTSIVDGTEAVVAFVVDSAWVASGMRVEFVCVTVACATTFPALSSVATTSTFTVRTLVPAWGTLRWNLRCELLMIDRLVYSLNRKG